jgi:predicted DNA-binding transcriptional regulator YafY
VRAYTPNDDPYGGATGSALTKRFETDKDNLQNIFGVEWRYRRDIGAYELIDVWEPPFDLPDQALKVMAFLQATFEIGAPMHDEVQDFLSLLTSYLPPERRGDLDDQRTALDVAWGRHDDAEIDPAMERGLDKALLARRLVAFDYYSPSQQDGKPRRHIVEPWQRYFDSVRGHYYLRGYCRQTTSEAYGTIPQRRYIRYRLSRMHNLEVLPDKLGRQPPHVPQEPLVYRLAPMIARRGEVSRHPGIEIIELEPQDDDSVIVHAKTDDIWWAVRTLLHYGPSCEVLGGREALYEMRRTVAQMADVYAVGE